MEGLLAVYNYNSVAVKQAIHSQQTPSQSPPLPPPQEGVCTSNSINIFFIIKQNYNYLYPCYFYFMRFDTVCYIFTYFVVFRSCLVSLVNWKGLVSITTNLVDPMVLQRLCIRDEKMQPEQWNSTMEFLLMVRRYYNSPIRYYFLYTREKW